METTVEAADSNQYVAIVTNSLIKEIDENRTIQRRRHNGCQELAKQAWRWFYEGFSDDCIQHIAECIILMGIILLKSQTI